MLEERIEVLAILNARTDLRDALKERYIKTTEAEIKIWKEYIENEKKTK